MEAAKANTAVHDKAFHVLKWNLNSNCTMVPQPFEALPVDSKTGAKALYSVATKYLHVLEANNIKYQNISIGRHKCHRVSTEFLLQPFVHAHAHVGGNLLLRSVQ